MVTQLNCLTKDEIFYQELLELYRIRSSCLDKHVAALAVDAMGRVLSVACNETTESCDHCECEKHPANCAIHAERGLFIQEGCDVYITTFPCKDCQVYLYSMGITRMFVFGTQHKEDTGLLDIYLLPDIFDTLVEYNGLLQRSVACAEFCELSTAVLDTMRKDQKDTRDVYNELVDVDLQLACLRRSIFRKDYSNEKCEKYNTILGRFK